MAQREGSFDAATTTLVPMAVQGLYWTLSGAWPLLSMQSFLAVTGPRTDLWLVRTVAALITVIGLTLLMGAFRKSRSPEVAFLAITGAMALIGVDVIAMITGTISPVYLLDAFAEGVLALMWAGALFIESHKRARNGTQRHLARQVFA